MSGLRITADLVRRIKRRSQTTEVARLGEDSRSWMAFAQIFWVDIRYSWPRRLQDDTLEADVLREGQVYVVQTAQGAASL